MTRKKSQKKERAARAPKSRDELLTSGIGDRLRKLRETYEASQVDFARSVGVAASTYCCWENGLREVPLSRRLQICREYHVRRDWLEFGSGRMFEKFNTAPKTDEQLQYYERLEVAQKFLAETSRDFRRALYALLVKEFEE